MFYYMHNNNNNYQCKMCWNKALTFGVGSIQLKFHAIVPTQYMHAKMFSILLLYTFQSNCAECIVRSQAAEYIQYVSPFKKPVEQQSNNRRMTIQHG